MVVSKAGPKAGLLEIVCNGNSGRLSLVNMGLKLKKIIIYIYIYILEGQN
jgi:hypothetical protein